MSWLVDASANRYTKTYMIDYLDLSGNLIIRNGYIKNGDNEIQFDNSFNFINIPNSMNVLTQLKANYDSVEYDVGLQCEKVDTLVSDLGTISPIVYDTAFKCTNFYYDQASNSTVWSGLLTCPISSIASTAIANSTRFIEGTGNQNVGGIKRFTSNIRIDSGMVVSNNTLTITNAQLALIPNIGTLTTKLTDLTYSSGTTTTNISNNTTLANVSFTGNINTFTKAQFDNAINRTNSLSVNCQDTLTSLQSQITAINGVSLSASNVFTGAQNQFTNNIRLDNSLIVNNNGTTLTNSTLNKIQYLSNVSSDINTSITNLNTSVSTLNTKTTKISYMSVGGINTTTILDGLISQTFSFTNTINNISTTVFGYLSGATENLQGAINALKTKTDTTNVNLANTTTSANEAKQRTTDIEFSDLGGNQTTISNKCVLGEVVFNTDLNDITPTTFSYLQGVNSSIQTQLDSKTRIPTGTIIMSVGDSLQNSQPLVWLKCNGQAVSRTTYVDLYQYILSRYGGGDGSTTFNVPNFQACFLRGGMYFPETERVVNGVTYTPNGPLTIQQDSLEAHVHSSNLTGTYLNSATQNGTQFTGGVTTYTRPSFPEFTGGVSSSHRTSPETRPLNHSIYYYIKT